MSIVRIDDNRFAAAIRAPGAQRTCDAVANRCTARAPAHARGAAPRSTAGHQICIAHPLMEEPSDSPWLQRSAGADRVGRLRTTSRQMKNGLLLTQTRNAPCHAGNVSNPHASRSPVLPARTPWRRIIAAPVLKTTTPQHAKQWPLKTRTRRPERTKNRTDCIARCGGGGSRHPTARGIVSGTRECGGAARSQGTSCGGIHTARCMCSHRTETCIELLRDGAIP
jgi:hypothetical protein